MPWLVLSVKDTGIRKQKTKATSPETYLALSFAEFSWAGNPERVGWPLTLPSFGCLCRTGTLQAGMASCHPGSSQRAFPPCGNLGYEESPGSEKTCYPNPLHDDCRHHFNQHSIAVLKWKIVSLPTFFIFPKKDVDCILNPWLCASQNQQNKTGFLMWVALNYQIDFERRSSFNNLTSSDPWTLALFLPIYVFFNF